MDIKYNSNNKKTVGKINPTINNLNDDETLDETVNDDELILPDQFEDNYSDDFKLVANVN